MASRKPPMPQNKSIPLYFFLIDICSLYLLSFIDHNKSFVSTSRTFAISTKVSKFGCMVFVMFEQKDHGLFRQELLQHFLLGLVVSFLYDTFWRLYMYVSSLYTLFVTISVRLLFVIVDAKI